MFVEAQTRALKARFTFSRVRKLDESRFQRLFTGGIKFPGTMPRACNETAPLALNTYASGVVFTWTADRAVVFVSHLQA